MSFGKLVSVQGRNTGKRYVELYVDGNLSLDDGQWLHLGITRMSPLVEMFSPLTEGAGLQLNGYGLVDGQLVYANGDGDPLFPPITTGQTVRIAVDLTPDGDDNLKIWVGVDDTWIGDPAAGTGSISPVDSVILPAGTYYACAGVAQEFGLVTAFQVILRARTSQFVYDPPAGFAPWEDG